MNKAADAIVYLVDDDPDVRRVLKSIQGYAEARTGRSSSQIIASAGAVAERTDCWPASR